MGKELITEILQTIRDTGNLRKSCEAHGVKHSTFLDWVNADSDLADQYARAREIGLEVMAHEILDIADDGRNDTYINEHGKSQVDADVVARSRLRVDSRKWLLSKLLPKKYGDKLDLTSKDEKLEANTLHITREVIGGK